MSVELPAVSSLGYIPKSRICGYYGNSLFNFLRGCCTVFHSGYTILHSWWQCIKGPVSLMSLTNSCNFPPFWLIAILMCIKWYLFLVWFAFLWWVMMLSIFYIPSCLYIFRREISIQILCLLLNWLVLLIV